MLPGKYKCNKCEPVYLTKEENIVIQGWFTSRLILNFLKLSMHHRISNLILEFSIFFFFFFFLSTTNIRMENDTGTMNRSNLSSFDSSSFNNQNKTGRKNSHRTSEWISLRTNNSRMQEKCQMLFYTRGYTRSMLRRISLSAPLPPHPFSRYQ